jgi:hypothetical protein
MADQEKPSTTPGSTPKDPLPSKDTDSTGTKEHPPWTTPSRRPK